MHLLKRFSNSILFLIKSLLYLGSFFILFGLLGIENRQVRVLSRTSVIMTVMFFMALMFFTGIYGGLDVGRRHRKSIVQGMELSIFFSEIFTYAVFLIMNVNEANGLLFRLWSFGYFLLALLINAVFVFLMTSLATGFYNSVEPPVKALIIISSTEDGNRVKAIVQSFRHRFSSAEAVRYDRDDIHTKIRDAGIVFFYDVPQGERADLVNYCYKHMINVSLNPDISDIVEMTAEERMMGDMPFLFHYAGKMTFEQRIVKRLSDITLSALILLITSPLFLIAAVMIKTEDGGRVFFRQKRATIRGRVFEILKFRTMKENVENISALKDDDRITRSGKLLRKYRIDELPQLINIIKGEMSLVGPRPEMLENVSEYESEMPEFRYRLRMKAGLTGLAQVMGRYNTSSRDKLVLDLLYIERFSILLDIKILFQTFLVLFNAEDSTEGF
ncbi:MAG: exopolysaccharide biosynthesis polyprenyl glycosylphosphotransferase [Lachnospiraceae bacterium]|nr:exopolysaccharide biosynthesis polyprenyl glycosylphosphotransferase [Lachnospiraceae bacterium]